MRKGVICPYCGYNKSMVVDTRAHYDGICRRRECDQCMKRFTTYEFTEDMVKRIKDRAFDMGIEEGREAQK